MHVFIFNKTYNIRRPELATGKILRDRKAHFGFWFGHVSGFVSRKCRKKQYIVLHKYPAMQIM